MTTLREGATSITECMPGGQNCSCPRGTYQPDSRMTACVDSLNHTIRGVGSYCKCKCDSCCCLNCGMSMENIPQNPVRSVRRRLSQRRSKRWENAPTPVKCTTPACRVRSSAAKSCLLMHATH
ncbi:hypothetical protein LSAT2_013738 [Lamellibrachia satsuma]|nr:hypothetical protein LSAT2_013738 [Lamellibrachia satsuma]